MRRGGARWTRWAALPLPVRAAAAEAGPSDPSALLGSLASTADWCFARIFIFFSTGNFQKSSEARVWQDVIHKSLCVIFHIGTSLPRDPERKLMK